MKIAVTGATGFIGRAVTDEALRRGHEIVILTRRPAAIAARPGTHVVAWGETGAALPPHDALINLASESVTGEWTEEKKREIVGSRRDATRRLVEAVRALAPEQRPRVLASASGIGYYAEADDAVLTEDSPAGTDFMAEVCKAWEAEAGRAQELGLRVACMRLCPVLGAGGGILARMLPRFRHGQGGPLGDGRKWFPWIHRADVVGLFLAAVEHDRLRGPVNAVSPGIVRGIDFARGLAEAVGQPLGSSAGGPPGGRPGGPPGGPPGGRPGGPPGGRPGGPPSGGPPTGGPGGSVIPGGPSGVLVAGYHVTPKAALAAGYDFRFPSLAGALKDVVESEAQSA